MSAPFEGVDATGLRESILAGERGVRETTLACLDAIEAADAELGAFLCVERESALKRAEELERHEGEPGPLHGVPVALKANLCWEGHVSNCGSKLLSDWRAPYTSTAVERLLAAGAIPVGVTNMDEFAMGSSGENSAFGPTKNPWDHARTPGGSSSGSAAAVAARRCVVLQMFAPWARPRTAHDGACGVCAISTRRHPVACRTRTRTRHRILSPV